MPTITKDIDLAVAALLSGQPVAIPTETVYGLAAPVTRLDAVRAVFEMKKRPLNHPLIVHVAPDWDLSQIVTNIPKYAQELINQFWPGPLTLVFQAREGCVPAAITGNQTTVAIRSPNHPLTLELLKKLKVPVVAPSANPFGRVSPTTAQHVAESFPEEELIILDGGRCSIGIESTIVDASKDEGYQILRHGLIDSVTLAQHTNAPCLDTTNHLRVPGKLDSHYQPNKPLYYFENDEQLANYCQEHSGAVFVIAGQRPAHVASELYHPLSNKPEEASYELYFQLRKADASKASSIAIKLPPATEPWLGVRERILKAGSAG